MTSFSLNYPPWIDTAAHSVAVEVRKVELVVHFIELIMNFTRQNSQRRIPHKRAIGTGYLVHDSIRISSSVFFAFKILFLEASMWILRCSVVYPTLTTLLKTALY